MPIPFLSRELPNLAIVDWCLIASQEVLIRECIIGITLAQLKKWSTMILMMQSPIDTSCAAIKHQSTIARFGDSLDKKGIGITPDPFGAGTYNLQSISVLRPKGLGDETMPA